MMHYVQNLDTDSDSRMEERRIFGIFLFLHFGVSFRLSFFALLCFALFFAFLLSLVFCLLEK